jgi:hypothetical protein
MLPDKQTIRENHLRIHGLSVNNSEVGKRIQQSAYDAMHEYGQLLALAFANWVDDNGFINCGDHWVSIKRVDAIKYTDDEIFQLFIDQNKN